MIHGYRGNAEQDMNGGVMRAFRLGRNALLIDQRGSGASEGNAITFGVKESQDCLAWVEFLRQKFGPDVKTILTGISMGAATVMIAAGKELPDNVIGVLADCGYTSAREIMYEVIKQMGLPPKIYQAITYTKKKFIIVYIIISLKRETEPEGSASFRLTPELCRAYPFDVRVSEKPFAPLCVGSHLVNGCDVNLAFTVGVILNLCGDLAARILFDEVFVGCPAVKVCFSLRRPCAKKLPCGSCLCS